MTSPVHEMPDLELVLMRRGIDALATSSERCERCRRVPLVGERVHEHRRRTLCDLCSALEREDPLSSRPVHGPAFGNSMRVIDHRAAA